MNKVRWSNEERMQLANMMHKVRSRHPELSFPQLGKQAQNRLVEEGTWSKDRIRNLAGVHFMDQLKSLLREIDATCLDALKQVPLLTEKIEEYKNRPSKEAILDSLTPQEIQIYFADEIFNNLTPAEIVSRIKNIDRVLDSVDTHYISAYLISRMSKEIVGQRQKIDDIQRVLELHQSNGKPINNKNLKIAIIGTHSDQFNRIKDACGDSFNLIEIDKMHIDKRLPSFDGLVMLGNHCSSAQREIMKAQAKSHNVSKERIFIVNGLSNAIEKILTIK